MPSRCSRGLRKRLHSRTNFLSAASEDYSVEVVLIIIVHGPPPYWKCFVFAALPSRMAELGLATLGSRAIMHLASGAEMAVKSLACTVKINN
jgi:hypothetical protein